MFDNSLNIKINEGLKKTLSSSDINNFLGENANIKTYRDLKKYDNIDDLLSDYGYCILLYETRDHFGHWTLIFKLDDKNICFFDSYGLKPDDQLRYIPKYFKQINNINIPYLTYLLYYSNYNVEYNEFKFQEYKKDINTCGRHILCRLVFNDKNIYQYKNILDKIKKKYNFKSYDKLITYMTLNI